MNHEELKTILKRELGDVKEFISYCFQCEIHDSIVYDVMYLSESGEVKEYSVIIQPTLCSLDLTASPLKFTTAI